MKRKYDDLRTGHRLTNKKWALANPEKARIYKARYIRKKNCEKRGITIAQFDEMLTQQNNRCSICSKEFVDMGGIGQVPVIDHCHTTGKVRGLLCHQCNVGVGYLKDSPDVLRKAAAYVERFAI